LQQNLAAIGDNIVDFLIDIANIPYYHYSVCFSVLYVDDKQVAFKRLSLESN